MTIQIELFSVSTFPFTLMSLSVTFVPVEFTIFTSPRLQHYNKNLRVIRAKYYSQNAILQQKIRPREPLTQEELQSLRLNERMIEKYPTTDLFLASMQQEAENQLIFVVSSDESHLILQQTNFPFIYLSNHLLQSITLLQFQNCGYNQILSILQPTKPQFTPIKFIEIHLQELQVDIDDGKSSDNLLFTMNSIDSSGSLDVVFNIITILIAEYSVNFSKIVFLFTQIMIFQAKFDDSQNSSVQFHFHTSNANEISNFFSIPLMDILDVRNTSLNQIILKINQRANSADILQKIKEKNTIKPIIMQKFPQFNNDLLVPVESYYLEFCKKFYLQNRKILLNDNIQYIQIRQFQFENQTIVRSKVVQFFHYQLNNNREISKMLSIKEFKILNAEQIAFIQSVAEVTKVCIQESIQAPSLQIPVFSASILVQQIQPVRVLLEASIRDLTQLLKDTQTSQYLCWQLHSPFVQGAGPIRLCINSCILMCNNKDSAQTLIQIWNGKWIKHRQIVADICTDSEGLESVTQYCKLISQNYSPCYCLNYKAKVAQDFEIQGLKVVKQQGEMVQIQFKTESDADAAFMIVKRRGVLDVVRINFD